MENQKYCSKCGEEIMWDPITGPAFYDPQHGQPRFYVRGECPNRGLGEEGHDYGLISDVQQGMGLFPLPYGIMSDHPAVTAYLEKERDEPSGAL
jgi:hypothetical protein